MGKQTTPKPAENEAIAYYRVSTAKQGASGLGLEAQQAAVMAYAKANGLVIVQSFVEIETGTGKRQRVEIFKALDECKRTGAKLLIAKLDRLARNVHFISGLMESHVDFVCVDSPNVTPLTLHVLAAVAEQEAKLISKRTKDALTAAKARGIELGTPANMTTEAQRKGAQANRARAIEANSKLTNYVGMLQSSGLTFEAIADRLNADGYRTRTGATFTPMAVWRMCKRVAD